MILGSDGVKYLEARVREQLGSFGAVNGMVSVDGRTVLALIKYYAMLTSLCQHDFHVSSPIDSAELCHKCGLFQACDPVC